jgi:hypothetical protein
MPEAAESGPRAMVVSVRDTSHAPTIAGTARIERRRRPTMARRVVRKDRALARGGLNGVKLPGLAQGGR